MTKFAAQEGTLDIPSNLHVPEDCRAVSEVLARVGDKWTVLVVGVLTLRGLERDGLVTRTVHATIPPRVDYELTGLGRSLLEPVNAMGLWARRNRAAIQEARRRFDAAAHKT